MMHQGDFKSFRSLFEELIIEAFNVEKDGVAVVFPGLGTLKTKIKVSIENKRRQF